jgi:hypothetical protein
MPVRNDGEVVSTQAALWSGAGVALAVAVVAALMDWRRHRRRDFDDVGWVPWRGIQVAAFFTVLACIVLAMRP